MAINNTLGFSAVINKCNFQPNLNTENEKQINRPD
jgi:hypothetical protein